MITGGCATLLTPDPERLARFYENLGLERRFAVGDWIELRAADGFRLALRRTKDIPGPGRHALGFASSWELPEARQRLTDLVGPPRIEEDTDSDVTLLWFDDPDGNEAYLWWARVDP